MTTSRCRPWSTPRRGWRTGAPLLYEELGTNLGHTQSLSHGDVDGAFASADKVVTLKVVNQRAPAGGDGDARLPGRLAARAAPGDPGELTLWTSTQIPHGVKTKLAVLLGIDENKVRVIAPEVGGGFGNKVDVSPEETLTAIAAMKLGRPVKWSETRSENFQAAMHGRGQIDVVEAAAKSDGRITGLKVTRDLRHRRLLPVRLAADGHADRPDAARAVRHREHHVRAEGRA